MDKEEFLKLKKWILAKIMNGCRGELIYNKISDLIYLNEIGYYSGLNPILSKTDPSTIHPRCILNICSIVYRMNLCGTLI